MSDPFAAAGASGVKITDYDGRLLLLTPVSHEQGIKTKYSGDDVKDAMQTDVVVLDGKGAPEELGETLIFQGGLIGQLRRHLGGKPLLGRLGKVPSDRGHDAWKFLPPTEADKKVARKYIAEHTDDPFAA